ncbi:hypothetical protein HUN13_00945 [Acinetobacter seifertii]|uniref:hypothetical protein n=1 Tax=Acinetobacter seifertii TaxID=1530123 RepID=UPI001580EF5E|nr:hypothetical protein [Acinetobacter seifertii]NUG10149.1 hypothetical protein [Acinetobacter seifertii]
MNASIKTPASFNIEENMQLWNQVFVTDPLAVKPITGKSYKGSSPKPYWLIEQATRVFGAAGYGWGHDIISQGFQQCGPEDLIHWAIVEFWYMKDNKRCAVQQMGGTKAMYKTNNGKMIVDEDAPKKSVTDALVKAMSSIGFAGDIFSGRWDDSKYQQEAYDHHHNQQPSENDFQAALKAIELAANRKALGGIYNHFVGTQYEHEIKAQCAAKSDKEGWSA